MAKKKIKDITLLDLKTICAKHYSCGSCPMDNICGVFAYLRDEHLNKEVEVDE